MAVTPMTIISNRRTGECTLSGSVLSVALDAAISEYFTLPAGFGELLIMRYRCSVGTFSGAYVAPAPADDGFQVSVVGANQIGTNDILGVEHFTNVSTQTARPYLAVAGELFRYALMRRDEGINVAGPILAGAGVTGAVGCVVVGFRISTA